MHFFYKLVLFTVLIVKYGSAMPAFSQDLVIESANMNRPDLTPFQKILTDYTETLLTKLDEATSDEMDRRKLAILNFLVLEMMKMREKARVNSPDYWYLRPGWSYGKKFRFCLHVIIKAIIWSKNLKIANIIKFVK